MTRIYFVRHARSVYNDEGRMAGLHDPPLSSRGREEALATAEYLQAVSIDFAFSSPLQRALETARLVLGPREIRVVSAKDLVELNMGAFSGRRWTDVLGEHPSLFNEGEVSFWQLFARDRIPGQERYHEAAARIMGFFDGLPTRCGDATVLVVGHKGVLEVVLSETIGFDPSTDWFDIDGASVTTFTLSAERQAKFHCVNMRPGRPPL